MTKPIYPHEMRSFTGMDELDELALDLRWSWDRSADSIWRPLAPELWDRTRNPWTILQTVAPGKLTIDCHWRELMSFPLMPVNRPVPALVHLDQDATWLQELRNNNFILGGKPCFR